ncbi:MAG: hypothetical protein HRU19_18655 [Pseudobacteriovorax sp.]|nr:hypothetical protein [Pseudobacteriovorax sp.]
MISRSKVYAYSFTTAFMVGCYLTACDPERQKRCEWYLVPNPKANNLMEPGWVSLCAANFELGRQKCLFTAKPEFVERFNGVPFKLSEMEYHEDIPRKITSITVCDPKGK